MDKRIGKFRGMLGIMVVLWVAVAAACPAYAASERNLSLKVNADRLLKLGEIDSAISLYERAVQRDGRSANVHYNLATAYYLKGEIAKAVESLEKFITLRPQDAEALYNLGCLKFKMGSADGAMDCFLRAVDCPLSPLISQKITEALQFMKDLRRQDPKTQEFSSYLATLQARLPFQKRTIAFVPNV